MAVYIWAPSALEVAAGRPQARSKPRLYGEVGGTERFRCVGFRLRFMWWCKFRDRTFSLHHFRCGSFCSLIHFHTCLVPTEHAPFLHFLNFTPNWMPVGLFFVVACLMTFLVYWLWEIVGQPDKQNIWAVSNLIWPFCQLPVEEVSGDLLTI